MRFISSIFVILSTAICGTIADPSSGCGKPPSKIKNGMNTISIGGKERTFHVSIPKNYDNKHPYRTIFTFHGAFGTAKGTAINQAHNGLDALAKDSTIFISPQGNRGGWWEAGGTGGTADLDFVDAMIQATDSDLCINTKQRFSTGFSFGGVMSYVMACTRPEAFRAVAVGAGANLDAVLSGLGIKMGSLPPFKCPGTKPVPYMAFMGRNDPFFKYGQAARDDWVRINGCKSRAADAPAKGMGLVTTKYDCPAEYPIEWTAYDAGHNPTPESPKLVWNFFKQFN